MPIGGVNQKMKKRISAQQIWVFVAVLALMFGIGFWVLQLSTTVLGNVEQARKQNFNLVNTAQQMRVDIMQTQQRLTDISATRGLDGLDDGFNEAETSYQSFLNGLNIFKQAYQRNNNQKGLDELATLRKNADHYYVVGKKMAHAYIDEGPASGNPLMNQFGRSAESVYSWIDLFLEQQAGGMLTAMNQIAASTEELKIGIIVIFVVGLIVTFVVSSSQGRRSSRRMHKILTTLESTAGGDLTVRLNEQGNNEMAQIAAAFNTLVEKMTEVIARVKHVTASIATGSEEISAGNTNLSQRTEEQASSLQETASSMDQMTATVRQNAESAQHANQLANVARDQAEKGGNVVDDAVSAMSAINDSSARIADIISTIDAIAFQTNLLALNAAVEAARAGEQGRGFAVVAGEVRTLAQRSADAAKEIKALIEDSNGRVKVGTDLVDESGATLIGIVGSINKVADIVSEINAASQEQSAGIEQVNKSITQMDGMTQQNAALVEQSAAASRSMQDQATGLMTLMQFFRVGNENQFNQHVSTAESPATHLESNPFEVEPVATGNSQRSDSRQHETSVAKETRRISGTDNQEWEDF